MSPPNKSKCGFWGAPFKDRPGLLSDIYPVTYMTDTYPFHCLLSFQTTQQCHCSDGNFTAKGDRHIPQLELAAVQISKPRARFFHWSFSSGSMLTSWMPYPQMCQAVIKSPVTQDLLQSRQRYCKGRENRCPANTRNHVVFTRTLSLVPATPLDQLQAFRVHTGLTPD